MQVELRQDLGRVITKESACTFLGTGQCLVNAACLGEVVAEVPLGLSSLIRKHTQLSSSQIKSQLIRL